MVKAMDCGIVVLYSHLPYHNDSIIKTHAERRKRKTQEETTQDKDARRLLYNYIYLSLYCKGSKGLFKVYIWEGAGDWTLTSYFDPTVMTVTLCLSCSLRCSTRGLGVHSIGAFPRAPSVGCGLPYHIWSLLSGSLLATALGPNNNSTPTRSPTGSLNRMFNRHQAEITVMQFRGYSLLVHHC